jgi:hypothetical protein
MMFTRWKRWLVAWAERQQQREIQRLHEEGRRLKEELLRLTGEERITLSPEQRRQLWEKAKHIDPEVLKQIAQFDLQDLKPPSASAPSAESP